MAPTTISLSPANIFNLSKNLIMPLHCEWGQCDIILNSWDHLLKHQYKHCRQSKKTEDGMYQCHQLKCSGRDHTSKSELMEHIKLSHMSRVPVPCLHKGCTKTFGQSDQLLDHLKNMHPYLLNITIPTSYPLLAKFAWPSIFSSTLPALPPLPSSLLPQSLILSPVVNKARIQQGQQIHLRYSQLKRWSRLDHQDDKEKEITIFDFADLPLISNCPQDIVVQPQDSEAVRYFSAPQSMESKPCQPPPSLFSFQALACYIAAQESHSIHP